MKLKFLMWVVLFCCIQSSWGQTFKISGHVTDKEHQPLEAAFVILRNLPDSTYLASHVTDKSGFFSLEVEKEQEYLLSISYLGFSPFEKTITPGNLGEICLQENLNSLGEVTVKGERRIVKSKNGKLVFNARQIAQRSMADNAYDIVLSLPGVRKNQDEISLIGSEVTIMVDGKPSTLSKEDICLMLQNMPAEQIADVEVMRQAPASYHAKGAVINFITNPSDRYAVEGLVSGKYLNKHHTAGKTSANLRFSSPKTTFDFMYALNRDNYYEPNILDSYHKVGGEEHHIEQMSRNLNQGWMNNFKMGLVHRFSKESLIDVSYFGKITPSSHCYSYAESNWETSSSHKEGEFNLHNLALYFKSDFGLKIGADYTRFHTKDKQELSITPKETNTTGIIRAKQGQTADRYKFFADMEHQLNNVWNLGYGTSYTYTSDEDYQIYTDNDTGKDLFDTDSPIKEHLTDMYVNVAYTGSGKHSFNASMKAEYCKNDRFAEWTFFPQLTYGYNESGNHAFMVMLSSLKDYPSFWSMHETVSHINGYMESQGTPGLKSMNTYTLNMNYILKQKYIFTLEGVYIDGPFFLVPYQDPNRLALIYKTLNWDHEYRIALNLHVPFSIGERFFAEYEFNGGYVEQSCDEFMDISFNRRKFYASADLSNYLKLNKNLLLELELYGQSKTPHGTSDYEGFVEASLGLKWKFAHEKMTLSMRCTDLFNSSYVLTDTNYKGQNFSLSRFKNANRAFEVNLSYRFGGYKTRAAKRVDTQRFGH